MNILVCTRYGDKGASSRLRFLQYLPYLHQHNIQCTVAPLLGNEYIESLYAGTGVRFFDIARAYAHRLALMMNGKNYDAVWLEKEMLPWVPAVCEMSFSRKMRYVVDYDDAVFHRYDMHANPLVRFLLGRKIDRVMAGAAAVVCGNDYLAERAVKAGAEKVCVLPTVVDPGRYALAEPVPHDKLIIGWIGSPVTAQYLKIIEPALCMLKQKISFKIVLVGSGPFHLNDMSVEIQQWAENEESAQIRAFDVGIMPLPDGPWERGKCGYKLIQYMAAGIPVVASPVGVNSTIVTHGINGFLASSAAEWTSAFLTLSKDPSARLRMGKAGRHRVEERYSLQVTAPVLAKILSEAADA